MSRTVRFAVLPDGAVELTADEGLLRHFRAEYGESGVSRPTRVGVSIVSRLADDALVDVRGGHKTVSWSVSLGRADADPLRATIALRGRPRWFGVSLVQGFFVEPLISIGAAVRGQVLLPAAAITEEGGALLLIGRSRSGKSSLSARALVLGRQVLGDDQVLIGPDGRIDSFPRRMRVYDDLMETSPVAHAALPPRAKLGLHLRRLVRVATRGFVAPSLAVPLSAFGGRPPAGPMPLHRVVVVRRSASATELSIESLSSEDAQSEAIEILSEQRRSLSQLRRDDWQRLLRSVERDEATILGAALRHAPAGLVTLPEGWGAAAAVEALARALDVT